METNQPSIFQSLCQREPTIKDIPHIRSNALDSPKGGQALSHRPPAHHQAVILFRGIPYQLSPVNNGLSIGAVREEERKKLSCLCSSLHGLSDDVSPRKPMDRSHRRSPRVNHHTNQTASACFGGASEISECRPFSPRSNAPFSTEIVPHQECRLGMMQGLRPSSAAARVPRRCSNRPRSAQPGVSIRPAMDL